MPSSFGNRRLDLNSMMMIIMMIIMIMMIMLMVMMMVMVMIRASSRRRYCNPRTFYDTSTKDECYHLVEMALHVNPIITLEAH